MTNKISKQIPSEELLQQVISYIAYLIENQKENPLHYCLFLLCYQAGLKINEAISFDLDNINPIQGFYQIS
jgi:integrase